MEDNLFASVDQKVAVEKQDSYYDTLLHKRQRPEKADNAGIELKEDKETASAPPKKDLSSLKPITPEQVREKAAYSFSNIFVWKKLFNILKVMNWQPMYGSINIH